MHKSPLVKNAIEIGDVFLRSVDTNWLSSVASKSGKMSMTLDGCIHAESLVGGSAGMNLFFKELYDVNKSDEYLKAIDVLVQRLLVQMKSFPIDHYGFYVGRMGVIFSMLESMQVLNKELALNDVVFPWKTRIERYLDSDFVDDSLYSGRAGTLLVLFRLFQRYESEWISELLDLAIKKVIRRGYLENGTISWNRSKNSIKGLTGWGHGSAGIGFVFLELGYELHSQPLKELAEMAFAYEDQYWNEEKLNWADLEKKSDGAEDFNCHREAFKSNDSNFFAPNFENYSWESGLTGIALSRTRAFELTSQEKYKAVTIRAAERISELHFSSPLELWAQTTLLTRAASILPEGVYDRTVHRITNQASLLHVNHQRKALGRSDLMYLGNLWLNLHKRQEYRSFLFPSRFVNTNGEVDSNSTMILTGLEIASVESVFPRTLKIIQRYRPNDQCSFRMGSSGVESFANEIETSVDQNLSSDESDEILSMCRLEYRKWKMISTIANNALLQQQEIYHWESCNNVLKLPDEELFRIKFSLSKEIVLSLEYFRDNQRINLKESYEPHVIGMLFKNYFKGVYMLIPCSELTVNMISIELYQALVLSEFHEPVSMDEVSDRLMNFLNIQTDETRQFIMGKLVVEMEDFFYRFMRDRFNLVLKDCVNMGVLVPVWDQ